MTDERIIALINSGIDGELNESEKSELQDILDQSSEARSLQCDLQDLANTLAALPRHEPPENLRKQILENTNLPAQKQQATGFFRLSSYTGYGLAIAAGLVMVVGIYRLGPQDPTGEDLSNMTGTIVEQTPIAAPIILDTLPVEVDSINGTVTLVQRDKDFLLEVELITASAMELVVEFDANTLQFEGISRAGGNSREVTASEGNIRIRTRGDAKFSVDLTRSGDGADAEVQVATSIYSGGARVHEGRLTSQQ